MALSYEQCIMRAAKAGREAGEALEVPKHIVTDSNGRDLGYEPFELCGFAWVSLAGNTQFGRWAKKNGVADKGYPKGLKIWVNAFNQSHARKEAYAKAFAESLRADLGQDDIHWNSRLD